MPTPCASNISDASGLSQRESDELAIRMHNLAMDSSKQTGQNFDEALRDIAGSIKKEEELLPQIKRRNALLNIQAKRSLKTFAARFSTLGEGVLNFLEGGSKLISGARNSVDYQGKALHGKYFGSMVSQMEEAGVLSTFRMGKLEREIYQEMAEIGKPDGQPGISKSAEAQKIAAIIDQTTGDMVAHQNRVGSYITRAPGYITRQTHDTTSIRALGDKATSYKIWSDFTRELLDPVKTYGGWDPAKFLRAVHEGLYSGIHGPDMPEAEVNLTNITQDLGRKASQSRVLFFKDADSAYKYNQAFGTRSLRDQVFSDLYYRSRSIAMMSALGPNPEATLRSSLDELSREARNTGDVKSLDSLNDWRIKAAYDTVSGKADIPANISLHRKMSVLRTLTGMAKMGGTLLSSFADKAFMQAEMAYQGISNLETLGKQLTGMAERTGEAKRALRMMGVAMDGLVGNTASRYTIHTTSAGFAHRANQQFFNLNFMNWWTDVNKASAAELMSGHLAEHANLPFEKLPDELSRVLALYDIGPKHWDAVRDTAYTIGGHQYITPDKFSTIGDDVISGLVTDSGKKPTAANLLRERDSLESKFRTYLADRTDMAIPTPGASERKFLTLGTQAGTPLGEGIRLLTMFKSFPLTIVSKILGREVYGRGAMSAKQWLMNDHAGKFHLASLIAMATATGYVSGAVRDALNGKAPEPLIVDGKINYAALNNAAVKGGGLGIMGDVLLSEYGQGSRDFLSYAAGPVFGQLGMLFEAKSKLLKGEDVSKEIGKMTLENTPYINLVYTRPVLNYLVLWNLQEMLSPGSLERTEQRTEGRGQTYFLKPSSTVR